MWDAPWHWVVVAIVVIALFGYKKLPDASRSLGRSLRIFKTELKGMADDDTARQSTASPTASAESAAAAVDAPAPRPAPTPQPTPGDQPERPQAD